jgi:putative two-component system response regulator
MSDLDWGLVRPPQPGRTSVLVVDDDEAIRALMQLMLVREGYHVVTAPDGDAAIRAVREHGPDLVVLDVGLPKLDGYEVTKSLRRDPRLATMPIILLTGRTAAQDIVTGLDAGADDFVSKPFEQSELLARIRSALRLRRALVGMEAAHAVVTALANAVEAKDAPTEQHCQRLATLAARIGARIGLSVDELDALTYGALLHDVGKIGVPDAILSKAGPLNTDEWELVRRHPEIGERICAPLDAFALFGPIIRHHHEHWDGSGYPDGLRAEESPIGARIVAVVDAFDAITHDRSYRAARSVVDGLGEMDRLRGRQFDPLLVDVLIADVQRMPSPSGDDVVRVPHG